MLLLLTTLGLSGQTQLKKIVFGSGGKTTNQVQITNVTIGQPAVRILQNETNKAFVGFWYNTPMIPLKPLPNIPKPVRQILSLKVFPNPASDYANIEYKKSNSPSTLIPALITVYDVHGRLMKEIDITNDSDSQRLILNTSGFSKGMYTINMKIGKNTISQKLIVL